MKTIVIAAGAAAVLAMSPVAAFADQTKGQIVSVETQNNAITLNDGKTYVLVAPALPASSLQVGDHVNVTYTSDAASGQMRASSVVVTLADTKS